MRPTEDKKGKKKISIPARFLAIINALLAFGLLVCSLAPIIPPNSFFSFISVLGIAYPLIAICNILFLVFWLIIKPKYIIISLSVLLISFSVFNKHFQLIPKKNEISSAKSSTHLMTYNVKYFYPQNKRSPNSSGEISDFIIDQSPDIVCFQEFRANNKGKYDLLKEMFDELSFNKYFFQKYFENGKQLNGLAIFTNYPIVGKGILKAEDQRVFSIFLDLVIKEGDTIRLFNTHFESIRLNSNETDFIANVNATTTKEELKNKPKIIFKKLRHAYRNRVPQIKQLQENIKSSPYPSFVCGDFNDPPSSWAYYQIDKLLNDSFQEKGFGSGISYNGAIPLLRIDYIFVPESFKVLYVKSHRVNFSDHYPQSSWFALKDSL